MFEGTLLPRRLDVPGLGTLSRSWFLDAEAKWRGEVAGVVVRVPGSRKRPAPEALAMAIALHQRLSVDASSAHAALDAERAESEQPGRPGVPRWVSLDVWPYSPRDGGAMAVFEVPWDEEHAWGVHLEADGRVRSVVVSPGPSPTSRGQI